MKRLIFFFLMLASSADAELNPYTELGVDQAASRSEINRAFSRSISSLMMDVMRGQPQAIRRSQTLAWARRKILSGGCEQTLVADAGDPDTSITFLHQISDIFPASFHLFDDEQVGLVIAKLAQDPAAAVQSLTLSDREIYARFPNDPTIPLLKTFQKVIAPPLGKYLRHHTLDQPQLLRKFETELVRTIQDSDKSDFYFRNLLSVIHNLDLSPGPAMAAIVPFLDDRRPRVARLAEGVLLAAAKNYGLPYSFEELLLETKNNFGVRILANSRKSFSPQTQREILARIQIMTDPDDLRENTRLLLERGELRPNLLEVLKIRWANPQEALPNRMFLAEVLLDNKLATDEVEYFLLRSIPFAHGEELHQLANWCYGSGQCPATVKAVIQSARLMKLGMR